MSVYLSKTTTGNLVTFMWQGTTPGDVVPNPSGIGFAHPTVLASGSVRLTLAGSGPVDYVAPVTIVLPVGVGYSFEVVEPGVMFCVYNLLEPGAVEELAALEVEGMKLYVP